MSDLPIPDTILVAQGPLRNDSQGRRIQHSLFGNPFDCGALISTCKRYRYDLWRRKGPRVAVFIGLNPSKADGQKNDPTILRCRAFGERWGFDGIVMVNLYGWRDTLPADLWAAQARGEDIVGPGNDEALLRAAKAGAIVIAAWGADPEAKERAAAVLRMLKAAGVPVHHLGLNADGSPKHPMARGKHRIPDDVQPQLYEVAT